MRAHMLMDKVSIRLNHRTTTMLSLEFWRILQVRHFFSRGLKKNAGTPAIILQTL